jgi:hypothetical protein
VGRFDSVVGVCVSLARPGMKCGSNSVGRVTAFQAVGRGFESRLPLSFNFWDKFIIID